MDRAQFESLVVRAIDDLPPEFRQKLDNVDIVVEDWPTPRQLKQARLKHHTQLLGLYQGVPRIRRSSNYGMVLPDKISIFQKPIEAQCQSNEEIQAKIGEVVRHEIAHHFGLDEKALRKLETKRHKKTQ